MRLFCPATTAHIPLQFGGCLGGPQFPVGPGAVLQLTFLNCVMQTGYDGFIIRGSRDNGVTWSVLFTGYNTLMSSSSTLELPPIGLRQIMAFSGTTSGTQTSTFPSGTVPGNMIFQVYFVSNSSVSASGSCHVAGIAFYASPLAQPSVTCTGDNTSFKVVCAPGDQRTTNLTVRDGATVIWTGKSCALDITSQTNDVTHNITVEGDDGNGNVSAPASCSVTPTCGTGAPPEALIQLKKLFGTDLQVNFSAQSTEYPCAIPAGVPRTAGIGYELWKANTPNGPRVKIASQGQATPSFNEQGALLNLTTEFLLEVTVDSAWP